MAVKILSSPETPPLPFDPMGKLLPTLPSSAKSLYIFCTAPKDLENFFEHLSTNEKRPDPNLLSNIVKLAHCTDRQKFSPKFLQKISSIVRRVLIPDVKRKLTEAIGGHCRDYLSTKAPTTYNFPQFKYNLQLTIIKTFLENYHLMSIKEMCQHAELVLRKHKICPKKPPVTEPIANTVVQDILDYSLGVLIKEKQPYNEVLFDPAIVLFSLWRSFSLPDKANFENKVNATLLTRCKVLAESVANLEDTNVEGVLSLSNELTRLLNTIEDTSFSHKLNHSLADSLLNLTNNLKSRILELFKTYHEALFQKKTGAYPKNICLQEMVGMLMRLRCTTSGSAPFDELFNSFENDLYQSIVTTFTPEVLKELSQSTEYDKQDQTVAECILVLSKFLDSESKDLKSFVECFDKIYFKLLSIREELIESKPHDLFFNTLVKVLRGFVQKAINEFESCPDSQNLDLSDEATAKLRKRLEILMRVISSLLDYDIEVKLTMKIKEDALISILYQLHYPISGPSDKNLKMIKEWIHNNPKYNMAKFQTWLLKKLQSRSPIIVMEGDLDFTYSQFVSETSKGTMSPVKNTEK